MFNTEALTQGLIEHPKRWSGDTHHDLGGSVDYEANHELMMGAKAEIEKLRSLLIEADKVTLWEHTPSLGMDYQERLEAAVYSTLHSEEADNG